MKTMVHAALEWMRSNKGIVWCVGICVVLHLLSAAAVGLLYPHIISPATDQLEYRTIALNLIDHGIYSIAPASDNNPDLMRTPLYPFFVAATFLFDRSGILLIFIQQLLFIGMGILLYLFLRSFSIGKLLSVLLVSVYLLEPQQWFYSIQTMTETLSSALLLFLLALPILMRRLHQTTHTLLFGFLLGLLILVKPTLIILAPFLLLYMAFRGQSSVKQALVRACIAGCIVFLVLVPWLVRNYLLTGTVMLSASPAYALVGGFGVGEQRLSLDGTQPLYNARGEQAGYVDSGYTLRGYPRVAEVAHEVLVEQGISAIALAQIKYAPTVWHSLSGVYEMFGNVAFPPASKALYWTGYVAGLVAMIASVAGLSLLFLKKEHRMHALVLFGMLIIVTFFNVRIAYARTLIPLYPIIFLGVALFVRWFFPQDTEQAVKKIEV